MCEPLASPTPLARICRQTQSEMLKLPLAPASAFGPRSADEWINATRNLAWWTLLSRPASPCCMNGKQTTNASPHLGLPIKAGTRRPMSESFFGGEACPPSFLSSTKSALSYRGTCDINKQTPFDARRGLAHRP